MEAVKEYTANGKTLKIIPDPNRGGEGPRQWDNLSRLIFVGKHKNVGDEHNFNPERQYESRENFMEEGAEDVRRYLKREEGLDVAYITPVHLYSHSGETISTSYGYPYNDRFDSGTCGFAVLTKQDIRKNWGIGRVTKKYLEKAIDMLEGEIKTLDQYMRGDVYGYLIEGEDGEEIDSCWGFYGDDISKNGILDYAGKEFREVVEAEYA